MCICSNLPGPCLRARLLRLATSCPPTANASTSCCPTRPSMCCHPTRSCLAPAIGQRGTRDAGSCSRDRSARNTRCREQVCWPIPPGRSKKELWPGGRADMLPCAQTVDMKNCGSKAKTNQTCENKETTTTPTNQPPTINNQQPTMDHSADQATNLPNTYIQKPTKIQTTNNLRTNHQQDTTNYQQWTNQSANQTTNPPHTCIQKPAKMQ